MIRLAGLSLAVFAVLLYGCAGEDGHKDGDHHDMQSHAGMGHGDMEHGTAAAALPAGANRTCPVMGDEVDPEVYVEHMGKRVYFCCDDCVKKFKADPEAYFKKAYPDAGK